MEDRIVAIARLCLDGAKLAHDTTGYVLSFAKDLIDQGWTPRAAKSVYFAVTNVLYGKAPGPRERAVHRIRFVVSPDRRSMTDSDEITKLLAESKKLLQRIEAILNEQRLKNSADTTKDETEPPAPRLRASTTPFSH